MVLNVVHRCLLTIILLEGVCQVVGRHIFLKDQVSAIFFIYKDGSHQRRIPDLPTGWGRDLPLFQFLPGCSCGHTFFVKFENQPHYLCLLFDNDVSLPGIKILPISEHLRPAFLSIFKALSHTPGNVRTDGSGLFLRKSCKNRQQHLGISASSIDVLLLEQDRRSDLLQMPYIANAVQRIPGEPADRLCKNPVNLPILRILDHLLKPGTLRCPCP